MKQKELQRNHAVLSWLSSFLKYYSLMEMVKILIIDMVDLLFPKGSSKFFGM